MSFNYGTGKRRLQTIRNLLKKCKSICYLCDKKLNLQENRISIDHVISLSWGGKDEAENWAVVHFDCNSIKEAKGAKKIYAAMKVILGLRSDKSIGFEFDNLQLSRYAKELPGLFGLSWNYIKKLYSESYPEKINKLAELIAILNIPEDKLNEYVNYQYKVIEINNSPENDFLSLVKNPRIWYKCNLNILNKLEKHPQTFYYGNKFLKNQKDSPKGRNYVKTRNIAMEFVVDFLVDILLDEYANILLDEFQSTNLPFSYTLL